MVIEDRLMKIVISFISQTSKYGLTVAGPVLVSLDIRTAASRER
jgi:hypothetical protein